MNYLVIDTETTIASRLVFDFGFVVSDGKGHILETFRALVSDVISDAKLFNATTTTVCDSEDFTAEKFGYYCDIIARHDLPIISIKALNEYMQRVVKRYNLKTWYAYNVAFDCDALNKTWAKFNDGESVFPALSELETKCIMCATQNSLCKTKGYYDWAIRNNQLTARGNIKTSAETAYRFITGNTEYREAHTALADALDETVILHHVRKLRGKREWVKRFDWQAIQKIAKANNW